MLKHEKKQLKEIKKAFVRLNYLFSSIKFGTYGKIYFSLCLKEEKEHLKMKPKGYFHGLTAHEGARLFYVKYIVDLLYFKDNMPTLKDVLNCRASWIYAGALIENYKEEIKKALEGINLEIIHNLDYAEIVKNDDEKLAKV